MDEVDPSAQTERELTELSKLRAYLEIIGVKIDYYSKNIDYNEVLEYSTQQ